MGNGREKKIIFEDILKRINLNPTSLATRTLAPYPSSALAICSE
jgi:hypothetical protein